MHLASFAIREKVEECDETKTMKEGAMNSNLI